MTDSTEQPMHFDLEFDAQETEDLLAIYGLNYALAARMGQPLPPDPWRALLRIGRAWARGVEKHGGVEAMARAMEAEDMAQAHGSKH